MVINITVFFCSVFVLELNKVFFLIRTKKKGNQINEGVARIANINGGAERERVSITVNQLGFST